SSAESFPCTSITVLALDSSPSRRSTRARSRASPLVPGIGRRTPRWTGQRRPRALVTLGPPRRDQRRIQPFPTQQGTLARLVQGLVLIQDARLVRRGVCPRPRLRRHLWVRHLVACTHRGMVSLLALNSTFQDQILPHLILTQRAARRRGLHDRLCRAVD